MIWSRKKSFICSYLVISLNAEPRKADCVPKPSCYWSAYFSYTGQVKIRLKPLRNVVSLHINWFLALLNLKFVGRPKVLWLTLPSLLQKIFTGLGDLQFIVIEPLWLNLVDWVNMNSFLLNNLFIFLAASKNF